MASGTSTILGEHLSWHHAQSAHLGRKFQPEAETGEDASTSQHSIQMSRHLASQADIDRLEGLSIGIDINEKRTREKSRSVAHLSR